MALGIVLLNTLTPIIYTIVIFVFLLAYVPIVLRIKKLRKRERALYHEITPTVFIHKLTISLEYNHVCKKQKIIEKLKRYTY